MSDEVCGFKSTLRTRCRELMNMQLGCAMPQQLTTFAVQRINAPSCQMPKRDCHRCHEPDLVGGRSSGPDNRRQGPVQRQERLGPTKSHPGVGGFGRRSKANVWSQRKPVVLSTGHEYTRWKTELLLGRMMKKAPACVRRYAQAFELHRQGHLAEAERIYAAILAARPDRVDSLHLLGMINLAQG